MASIEKDMEQPRYGEADIVLSNLAEIQRIIDDTPEDRRPRLIHLVRAMAGPTTEEQAQEYLNTLYEDALERHGLVRGS